MEKKVLVVDDDQGILEAFKAMLESEGYLVEQSATGKELKTLNKSNMPDVILLDVLLSGEDGREICKRLKKNPVTKHIPVVMLSAAPEMKLSVITAGADAFLAKPFDMNKLLSLLATLS